MAFVGVKVCTIALTSYFMKVGTCHLFKGKDHALIGSDEALLGSGTPLFQNNNFRIIIN